MFCCHVSLLSSNLRQFLGLLGRCQAALSFLLGPRSGQESGAGVKLWLPTQGACPREEQPKLGLSLAWATALVRSSLELLA